MWNLGKVNKFICSFYIKDKEVHILLLLLIRYKSGFEIVMQMFFFFFFFVCVCVCRGGGEGEAERSDLVKESYILYASLDIKTILDWSEISAFQFSGT